MPSREAIVWQYISLFENIIVLSNEFFEEVMEYPLSTDLEIVNFLSSAPAVLDLFVW